GSTGVTAAQQPSPWNHSRDCRRTVSDRASTQLGHGCSKAPMSMAASRGVVTSKSLSTSDAGALDPPSIAWLPAFRWKSLPLATNNGSAMTLATPRPGLPEPLNQRLFLKVPALGSTPFEPSLYDVPATTKKMLFSMSSEPLGGFASFVNAP